jgi:hypothetical protein
MIFTADELPIIPQKSELNGCGKKCCSIGTPEQ